ncbi:hypothetical protein TNCV_3315131 [Trichonephila clavipes]|nr:hypothetical protein TNCV_3315131 [Trichonephila clavipes]
MKRWLSNLRGKNKNVLDYGPNAALVLVIVDKILFYYRNSFKSIESLPCCVNIVMILQQFYTSTSDCNWVLLRERRKHGFEDFLPSPGYFSVPKSSSALLEIL